MFSADALLLPIRPDQPAGDDLAFSPELDAIQKARDFDDPSLDQGEWVTELKEADWEFVVKRCSTLLETKSKDLRLAIWLAEAGAKKYHMRGLAEGLMVIAGLFEQYWDNGLYPESEDEDHDQRIGNLSWILARIPALVREMPVTDSGRKYSMMDFETARKNPNHPELKLAELDIARRSNASSYKAAFLADAKYCAEALVQLENAADARLGRDSPGFASARDAVQTMVHLMPAALGAPVEAPEAAPVAGVAGVTHAAPAVAAPSGPPGAINTRSQAITQLRMVAEFFRRTEPHSPVSYFADKAANAGEQDLHEWLRSVIKDPASMAHIEELLGVRPHE